MKNVIIYGKDKDGLYTELHRVKNWERARKWCEENNEILKNYSIIRIDS